MVLATNWLEFGGIAAGAAAVATTALAALTGWLAWSARELAAALSVQGEMTSKRVRAMNGTALPVLRQREGSGNAEVVMRWEYPDVEAARVILDTGAAGNRFGKRPEAAHRMIKSP